MRYFLSNGTYPLKYLSCGNLISKEEFLHHRRNISPNVLIMVKEGTLYISQNGRNYELGSNQYILLRGNEEHYGIKPSTGRLSYYWVHFDFSDSVCTYYKEVLNKELDTILKDRSKSYYIIPEVGTISLTQRAPLLFNQLLDLSRQELIYSNQILDYALSLLIMEISQEFIEMHYKIKNNISPNVARIMEWMKGNYYKNLRISEIASEFGYNPDYLSTLFVKNTGTTISNYMNKIRIDISKSLIINYDLSVKEVAYSCGFSDEKYFMKVFKKQEGMTPSQYKKAFIRKMINTN